MTKDVTSPITSPTTGATIVLDATGFCTSIHHGLNRYTAETIAALADLDQLQIFSGDRDLCQQFPKRSQWVKQNRIHQNNLRGNLTRLLWHQLALPQRLRRDRRTFPHTTQLFYSPVPEGMLRPVCPQVLTLHDLLPLKFPDVYPRIKYYFRWILPRLLQASQTIVVSSDNTRRDVQHYWPHLRTPSVVLPIPYRPDVFNLEAKNGANNVMNTDAADRAPLAVRTPYLLCVGETRPYKNIRRGIEAFARLLLTGDRPGAEGLTLAIVGQLSRLDTDLVDLPQQLGIADRVQFVGRVTDRELARLYRGAAALLFPSLYEGFGLPPLEAMACGCPTIVARSASLPEVCGDAAHYIDPLSVEDIAAGMAKVTSDHNYADRLRQLGLARVQQFQPAQFRQRLRSILGV